MLILNHRVNSAFAALYELVEIFAPWVLGFILTPMVCHMVNLPTANKANLGQEFFG